jgi:hypothetical protein
MLADGPIKYEDDDDEPYYDTDLGEDRYLSLFGAIFVYVVMVGGIVGALWWWRTR